MEALNLLASLLKLELRSELERQGHVATSTLQQSIEVAVTETITGFEIVGRAAYYARFVNDGRKAGGRGRGVPVEALMDWIRQRKIDISGMSLRSQAFMYQRSIKNKGIPASKFIEKTLAENETAIENRIAESMGSIVNSYVDRIFKEIK